MNSKIYSLVLPETILKKLDQAAKKEYTTKAVIVRRAIQQFLEDNNK